MSGKTSATNDAKALAHPLRVRILETIERLGGVASPNQIASELGEPLGNVSYHIKTCWSTAGSSWSRPSHDAAPSSTSTRAPRTRSPGARTRWSSTRSPSS